MKKKKILPIMLLVLIVSLAGSTFAWFFSNDTVINAFKTEEAKISITPEEEFDNNKDWDGSIKSKVVTIKNDKDKSNVDVLIRVNLTPRWVDKEGYPFAGDVNLIQLVYDQVSTEWNIENKWINGNDGYYYYKDKVSPGSSTTALLNSVKVKDGLTIPDSYSGKDFIVDINAEAVVADKDTFKTVWNITDEKSNVYNLLSNIVNN